MREPCQHPAGITIKPDGVHELDPCLYRDIELHTKVDLTISRCERCGKITFAWTRTDETEDFDLRGDGPK